MTKQINSDAIAASFDSTFEFNDISKQFEGDAVAGLDLQASLCFEETSEVIQAFEEWANYEPNYSTKTKQQLIAELAKEAVDLKVVSDGLLQKIHATGLIDMNEVLMKVAENNLSKFPTNVDYNWCSEQDYEPVWNESYGRFVLKDANGKTMKPLGYSKVNLLELVNVQAS
mgnify:FL=1